MPGAPRAGPRADPTKGSATLRPVVYDPGGTLTYRAASSNSAFAAAAQSHCRGCRALGRRCPAPLLPWLLLLSPLGAVALHAMPTDLSQSTCRDDAARPAGFPASLWPRRSLPPDLHWMPPGIPGCSSLRWGHRHALGAAVPPAGCSAIMHSRASPPSARWSCRQVAGPTLPKQRPCPLDLPCRRRRRLLCPFPTPPLHVPPLL